MATITSAQVQKGAVDVASRLRRLAWAAVAASVLGGAAPTVAQTNWVNPDVNALRDEVQRLRSELGALTGGVVGAGGFQGGGDLSSDVLLRLGQFENQLRAMTGRLEQLEFQVQQLAAGRSADLDGLRFRLEAIEGRLSIAPPAGAQGFGQSGGFGEGTVSGAPIPPQGTFQGSASAAPQGRFDPNQPVVGQELGGSQAAGGQTFGGQQTAGAAAPAQRPQPPTLLTTPNQTANAQAPLAQASPGQVARAQQGGGGSFSGVEVDESGNLRFTDPAAGGQVPVVAPSQGGQIAGAAPAPGALGAIPGQSAPGASSQSPIVEQGGGADAEYRSAVERVRAGAFEDAERRLRAFVTQYPADDRVGDAKYWIGETHYVRGQFAEAARVFLDAYREHPGASRAPDSLLKLGMTFAQLNQRDEACLTFREVNARFPGAPKNVLDRAEIESRRVGCG